MQALELAYRAADYITVSTLELAHRYKGYYCDKPFKAIPNGWDKSMRGWAYRHNKGKVHIGYAGSLTHFNDVKPIMPVLIEHSREFEEVVVVIAACEDLYALLRKLPESRKIFLPGVDYTAYPAVLGWFDIMLAPLSNSYFNQDKSDIKLVEAGAKGIPFVASPLPFYKEYASDGRGGLFADWNEGSWYDNIKHLGFLFRSGATRPWPSPACPGCWSDGGSTYPFADRPQERA